MYIFLKINMQGTFLFIILFTNISNMDMKLDIRA